MALANVITTLLQLLVGVSALKAVLPTQVTPSANVLSGIVGELSSIDNRLAKLEKLKNSVALDDYFLSIGAFDTRASFDFRYLMPNDGKDVIVLKHLTFYPTANNAICNIGAHVWGGGFTGNPATDLPPLTGEELWYFLYEANPTYVNSGGLDRAPYQLSRIPLRLPCLPILFAGNNAQLRGIITLSHPDYTNALRLVYKATGTAGIAPNPEENLRGVWRGDAPQSASTTSTSEVVFYTLSLPAVLNIKKLSADIVVGTSATTAGQYVKGQYSPDGSTWYDFYDSRIEYPSGLPSAVQRFPYANNVSAKYIRFVLKSAAGETVTLTVFNVMAWVKRSDVAQYQLFPWDVYGYELYI